MQGRNDFERASEHRAEHSEILQDIGVYSTNCTSKIVRLFAKLVYLHRFHTRARVWSCWTCWSYLHQTSANIIMSNHEDHVKSMQIMKKYASSLSKEVQWLYLNSESFERMCSDIRRAIYFYGVEYRVPHGILYESSSCCTGKA